jgi:predicted site-specific integrase-resolvase
MDLLVVLHINMSHFLQTRQLHNSQISQFGISLLYRMVFKPATFFKNQYGISSATLRNWAEGGKLDHIRLPGGKRMYSVNGVTSLLGQPTTSAATSGKHGVIYVRAKHQGDLDRQIHILKEAYPNHQLIQDIGSGVDFNRPGLQTLLERIIDGMVEEVVIMRRDRLARIGFELLEFIFKRFGTRLVVHCKDEDCESDELADDLLTITTHLINNGHSNRKRKREQTGEKAKTEQ